MPEERKKLNVVAAVIQKDDRILATQRGYGEFRDWWEFPGGKIEQGETPQEALKREILEELRMRICVNDLLGTIEYDYPDFHLSMQCFRAEIEKGTPVLTEHEAARWLRKDELDQVRWLPADETIIDTIRQKMNEERKMQVWEKIFEVLKEKGMSQREFSRRTGIPPTTVSDWKGKKVNPNAEKILAICQALEITPYELLGDEDDVMIIRKGSQEHDILMTWQSLGQRDQEIFREYMMKLKKRAD